MAITSEATTLWAGTLFEGSGTVSLDSSTSGRFPVTWAGRSEGVAGQTNPEELLGAAHSACYAMAFSNALSKVGLPPDSLQVTAAVTFQPGTGITGIHLLVTAHIPGIDVAEFERLAEDAKANCPISQALAGVPITLEATLG